MTQFDDRLEGEMKTHENELIRKAIMRKYGSRDLIERIRYIMTIHEHNEWTANQMFSKLTAFGIGEPNTEEDVSEAFKNPANTFPSKVER